MNNEVVDLLGRLLTVLLEIREEIRGLREDINPPIPPDARPFNSTNSDAYHNHPDCPFGKLIEPHTFRDGTGGKRLCRECVRLHSHAG